MFAAEAMQKNDNRPLPSNGRSLSGSLTFHRRFSYLQLKSQNLYKQK